MKNYKIDDTRLAQLFKQGRERWKEKALSRQKKLRAIRITVRDLTLSREQWKQKALDLEMSLKEKESEIEELKKKLDQLQIEKQ